MGREARSNKTRKPEDIIGSYGFYFVAYVDLLGQREELMTLTELPMDDTHHTETMAVLGRTAGRVIRMREAFQAIAANADRFARQMSANATREQRQRIHQIAPSFRQLGFSDSFVISTQLGNTDRHLLPKQLHSIWLAMMSVATMTLTGLADGIPLRGGIDVERALSMYDHEVYGPALVNAYRLECSVSKYPRTAVGKGLMSFLAAVESEHGDDLQTATARGIARDCRELIVTDADGVQMLHILSRPVLGLSPEVPVLAARARTWVADQVRRFKFERNEDLAERYSNLYRYIERHTSRVDDSTPPPEAGATATS